MLHLNTLGWIVFVLVALNVAVLVLWLACGSIAAFLYGTKGKDFSHKVFSPLFRAERAVIAAVGKVVFWPIHRHFLTVLEEKISMNLGPRPQHAFDFYIQGRIEQATVLFKRQEELRERVRKGSFSSSEDYQGEKEHLSRLNEEVAAYKSKTYELVRLAKKAGLTAPSIKWSVN